MVVPLGAVRRLSHGCAIGFSVSVPVVGGCLAQLSGVGPYAAPPFGVKHLTTRHTKSTSKQMTLLTTMSFVFTTAAERDSSSGVET